MEIAPFELAVPQTDLDDLARRLNATRWPVPLPGDDWNTGVPVEYL
jgi:epoxide hydrolase